MSNIYLLLLIPALVIAGIAEYEHSILRAQGYVLAAILLASGMMMAALPRPSAEQMGRIMSSAAQAQPMCGGDVVRLRTRKEWRT